VTIAGQECGAVEVPFVLRMISSGGMDVARDPGSAVSDDYKPPFEFQGSIHRLIFEIPDRGPKAETEARKAQIKSDMARQ
jgi:hypothetical protein